jgi:predicted dehydrogenase
VRSPLGVAVVAARDSGLDLLRTFADAADVGLIAFCDLRSDPVAQLPGPLRIQTTLHLETVLDDDSVDAVAISAPLRSRGALVAQALDADKHVFVVGAPADNPVDVAALLTQARARRRCLFDAYDGEFRPSVQRLRRLLDSGVLGDVFYLGSVHREVPDAGAAERVWEICAEKIALILGLLRDEPIDVAAWGESYTSSGRLELLHAHLRFATGITAHVELSVLEGRRFTQTRLVGSRLTALAREREGVGSLQVCASHDDVTAVAGPLMLELEAGDAVVRAAPDVQPLAHAVAAFLDATRLRRPVPIHDSLAVAATLEQLQRLTGRLERDRTGGSRAPTAVIALPRARKHA